MTAEHDEQAIAKEERAEAASAADPREPDGPGPEGRHPGREHDEDEAPENAPSGDD